jgi:hypothetical protein
MLRVKDASRRVERNSLREGMNTPMFMDSSSRIVATSQVNIKTRLRALVYGEDERVINPGDLLLVAEKREPSEGRGESLDRFEIYINGRDIQGLLGQVERAAWLYRQNQEWLNQPSSRYLTATEINERVAISSEPKPKPAVDPERLAVHLQSLKDNPPKLFG